MSLIFQPLTSSLPPTEATPQPNFYQLLNQQSHFDQIIKWLIFVMFHQNEKNKERGEGDQQSFGKYKKMLKAPLIACPVFDKSSQINSFAPLRFVVDKYKIFGQNIFPKKWHLGPPKGHFVIFWVQGHFLWGQYFLLKYWSIWVSMNLSWWADSKNV